MKKIILIMAIVLMASVSWAGPFLICDPQAGVTHYKLTGPAWVTGIVPAQADGSIRMDVSAALAGSNALTVAACRSDAVWGELCSSTVPFVFTRPSVPATTSNIRLTP